MIKKLIEETGGIKAFSVKYEIPYRTVQNWKSGTRQAPRWLPGIITKCKQTSTDHIKKLKKIQQQKPTTLKEPMSDAEFEKKLSSFDLSDFKKELAEKHKERENKKNGKSKTPSEDKTLS